MSTLITNSNLKLVIEGINRGSFCKVKATERYVSIAHYVTLQSMQCIQLKESYLPDGYSSHQNDGYIHRIDGYSSHQNDGYIHQSRIFIWLPTPNSSTEVQAEYVAKCRNLINDLLQQNPDFTELVLDLRCNIGGVLAVFINAILPIIAGCDLFKGLFGNVPDEGQSFLSSERGQSTFESKIGFPQKDGLYMDGKDVNDKTITTFKIKRLQNGKLQHEIDVNGDIMTADLLPVDIAIANKFRGKRISILCNRYTMSSGEILCMLFRYIGELGYFDCKLYGEKTRGLTNGCIVKGITTTETDKTLIESEVMVPIYYLGCGGTYYKNGITTGILPLSSIKL